MSALTQGTKQWKELRKTKIGGSDAPIIMEVSPWKTPFQLWAEKMGLEQEPEQNEAMLRGLAMEEVARQTFENENKVIMFPKVIFHRDYRWMMASLDGIDSTHSIILEIKCPGKNDHSMAQNGKIPEKYFPQLQHQLAVSGVEMAYYYSFDGKEGVTLECKRDDEYIEEMIQKEMAFYECMQKFLAPEFTERDFEVKEDQIWIDYAENWKKAKTALILAEKKEKKLRESLLGMMNGRNVKGGGIRVTRVARKGVVDYTTIPELEDVDLEIYRKRPTEFWKITEEKE